jgi:hypothetical protein
VPPPPGRAAPPRPRRVRVLRRPRAFLPPPPRSRRAPRAGFSAPCPVTDSEAAIDTPVKSIQLVAGRFAGRWFSRGAAADAEPEGLDLARRTQYRSLSRPSVAGEIPAGPGALSLRRPARQVHPSLPARHAVSMCGAEPRGQCAGRPGAGRAAQAAPA